MRLTLAGHAGSPDVDLDVAKGVRLGDLRPHLARVTGRAELAGAAGRPAVGLAVADEVLDDDQVTGAFPLVPGALVRTGGGPADVDRAAMCSAWHLAVVAGPDAGGLVPLDVPTVVGRRPERGGGGSCPGRDVAVDDPAVSERQIELLPGRDAPRARDLGSRNGTVLVRAGRPGRVVTVPRRGRRLGAGDRIVLGATVLEVRTARSPRPRRPARAQRTSASLAQAPSTWVAPAVGAVVLAAATGNRLLLLLAVVGPATALGGAAVARCAPRVRAWRAARRRRRPGSSGLGDHGAGVAALPVAADLRTTVLAGWAGGGTGAADRWGSSPAAGDERWPLPGARRAGPWGAAEGSGPGAGRGAATSIGRGPTAAGPPGPGGPEQVRAVRALAPDGCLAVVGPRGPVLAVARLLACAEASDLREPAVDGGPTVAGSRQVSPPATAARGVAVVADPQDAALWRWARWVAPGDGSPALVVVDRRRPAAVAPGTRLGGRATTPAPVARPAVPAVLLVAPVRADVPPWCRSVLEVARDGRTTTLTRPASPALTVTLCGVSIAWADRQARLVHGLEARRARDEASLGAQRTSWHPADVPAPRSGPGAPAAAVALADLPGIPAPDPASILGAWELTAVDDRRSRVGPGAPDAVAPDGSTSSSGADAAPGGGPRAGPPAAPRSASVTGLPAAIGVGPDGHPVVLDLVRDGPHGLVAGTTGAGKSGLLQTWVLALALTRSPADLAILLVDYKGGAGFGACARLPHVVGLVTDLDAGLAARALTGLRAELRRREEVLAGRSVPDLSTLRRRAPDEAPPRLLVVVDEFRALADDLPTFVPGLLRVAAQGRSLGVHLVLATQRPGGAIGPDLRANLALRVALRVTDASESLDVVDVPDAASIPPLAVGRAVVRRGSTPPHPLQVAHADAPPAGSRPLVRRVDDAGAVAALPRPRVAGGVLAPVHGARADTGQADTRSLAWVEAARQAARQAGLARPEAPWLPPLPEHLTLADLCARTAPHAARPGPRPGSADGTHVSAALPVAVADHPAYRRQEVVAWTPQAGPLLVCGAPGSGRTTVLRTLATVALDRGWHVHTVGSVDTPAVPPEHPGAGTVVAVDDPRRTARLLRLLAAGRPDGPAAHARPPQLVLVDGLEEVLDALEPVARGRARQALVDLLRDGHRRGVAVAATTTSPGAPSGLRAFTTRLVLRLGDTVAEAMAGVPGHLVGQAHVPGRGVWIPGGSPPASTAWASAPALCQVALPTGLADGTSPGTTGPRGRPGGPAGDRPRRAAPGVAAIRLRPMPAHVARTDLPPATAPRGSATASASGTTATRTRSDGHGHGHGGLAVPVGLGGDDAGPLWLEVGAGALVAGPSGSGRSTALATVAAALLDAGAEIAVVARDGPLRSLGEERCPEVTCGHAAAAVETLVDVVGTRGRPGRAGVLLIDDLDALEQRHPELSVRLADLLAAGPGEPRGPGRGGAAPAPRATARAAATEAGPARVLIASALTGPASVAFRGALGALRSLRCGLVLTPTEPGSSEVFGVDLSWEVDLARPHAPGRGVVVHGREVAPVQVAVPG